MKHDKSWWLTGKDSWFQGEPPMISINGHQKWFDLKEHAWMNQVFHHDKIYYNEIVFQFVMLHSHPSLMKPTINFM